MGKTERRKGKAGENTAKRLLTDRDWEVLADTTAGLSNEDLICISPDDGTIYCVEVKNCKIINVPLFRDTIMRRAKKRAWLLMMKIDQTSAWLVMGRSRKPAIWHEKGSE